MAKRTHNIALLAGMVYFSQGALGLTGIALPLFLRNLRWTVAEITTVSSLAAIPWVLKIVYGLLSDSFPLFGYRRKSYLVLFAAISAIGWLLLVLLPSDKHWILFAMMMTNLGFAATDVITDGLIVEHSTRLTSHIYQSIAWGSRSLGALVTGFIGGWLAEHWLPQEVFLLTMCLPLTVMFCVLWLRDKKMDRSPFKTALMPVVRCGELIATSNLRWFSMILIIAAVSSSFGMPFFFHMKENLGFNETFLGLLASLGWGGALVGSFIYGKWLRKVSVTVTLRWAIFLNSVNILMTLLIFDRMTAFAVVFIGGVMACLTILPIMSSAAILTHRTKVEGTLFAVLMSIYNLGQIGFGFLGGKLFERIGLQPLIIGTGAIALTGLLLLPKLDLDKTPKKSC